MPNHVTNRLTIIGSKEQVKEVVDRFSTFHEKKPHKSFKDELTYEKDGEKYSFGWLNEETGMFNRRGMEDVKGVPEGYVQHFEEAWTSMPDFNKVIPQPSNIFNGSLGKKEEEMCALEGRPTWYDWNRENWGTKWDGYSNKKITDNTYEFQTAWNGVPKIIRAISVVFPNIEIEYKYADEDTGSNVGHLKFKSGVETFRNIPEGGSTDAFTLAFELNPEEAKHYDLVDGEWIYKDED